MESSANQVIHILRNAGHTAYFAGGCVRDRLLDREAKDIDIASSASPCDVEALFPHTHAIGKAFGVIQVIQDQCCFEVATFRRDLEYLDGRRPEAIEASNPEEDAQRRDFTINALFYDPVEDRIIDFVGGEADLKQRVIRAVGDPDERFREDHLRMLRAVRFATTLGFKISPETRAAIEARAEALTRISPERIREEFVRTLTDAQRPGDALELLADTGLLAQILPEALELKGCEQPPEFHPEGDVWKHTVMMLNELRTPSPELVLAVLLHDIGKPATYEVATLPEGSSRIRFTGHAQVGARMAREWMMAMKFSKARRDAVVAMVDRHMNFMNVPNMKRNSLRKLIGDPLFDLELELHKLDCRCSNGITESAEILEAARDEFANEPVLPDPWITGRDLMDLGLGPGQELGQWKRHAYDQQLSGEFSTKDALLHWVKTQLAGG